MPVNRLVPGTIGECSTGGWGEFPAAANCKAASAARVKATGEPQDSAGAEETDSGLERIDWGCR